jgi:hypothetical protein
MGDLAIGSSVVFGRRAQRVLSDWQRVVGGEILMTSTSHVSLVVDSNELVVAALQSDPTAQSFKFWVAGCVDTVSDSPEG